MQPTRLRELLRQNLAAGYPLSLRQATTDSGRSTGPTILPTPVSISMRWSTPALQSLSAPMVPTGTRGPRTQAERTSPSVRSVTSALPGRILYAASRLYTRLYWAVEVLGWRHHVGERVMAALPQSDRWDLTNWTSGPVTLFQALGITKGTISYPELQATLPAASASSSSSTGGGNTTAPASTSEADWIKALLTSLGAPQTTANINSLTSWIQKETTWNDNSPDGALYTNNPLNTSQAASGATSIGDGSVVKKYVTAVSGITATVQTIQQYPAILAALKSGNGLCGSTLSSSFSKWSGNGYDSVC
jgi:hypothetical protein